jgi:hypothetical protein
MNISGLGYANGLILNWTESQLDRISIGLNLNWTASQMD